MISRIFWLAALVCRALLPAPGYCQSAMDGAEIVHGLAVSKTEVTQALYRSVTGQNPSARLGDQLPVESVTWYQAVDFCNRLSLAEGLDPVYGAEGADRTKTGWRLPTEGEWSALAAGGSAEPSSAWYLNTSGQKTHPVAQLSPNAYGLFDLFGNVWEWCDADLSSGLQADHGGGFRTSGALLTASARGVQGPGSWADDLGFRIVRTLPTSVADFSKDSK